MYEITVAFLKDACELSPYLGLTKIATVSYSPFHYLLEELSSGAMEIFDFVSVRETRVPFPHLSSQLQVRKTRSGTIKLTSVPDSVQQIQILSH